MSGIYDGEGGVILDEKELYIPLPRERRHELVITCPMYRGGRLGQLMPVRKSHVDILRVG